MDLLIEILLPLIVEFGLNYVLQQLVDKGILPASVLAQAETAQEHEPFVIEDNVQHIVQRLDVGMSSLDNIANNARNTANSIAGIQATLANLATQVANIPSAPGSDANAEAVWLYPNNGVDTTMGQHMAYFEYFMANVGELAAFILQNDPFLIVQTTWKYPPD